MEKKFKNKIAVTGSIPLRKAFKDELLSIGYEWKAIDRDDFKKYTYLKNNWNEKWGMGNSDMSTCGDCTIYNLPEQWNEALKAASEVVEEIPEYVECIKSGVTFATAKKIYKVVKLEGDILTFIGDYGRESWIGNVLSKGRGTGHTDFKLSTKEAFDKQNKPIYKVGDWVYTLIDFKHGYKKIGDVFQIAKISAEYLFFEEDKSVTSDRVRLATSKEIADNKPTSITLTLGTSNIKVTIYKDGIIKAEGHEITIFIIKQLIIKMEWNTNISEWSVTLPIIKIGCSTFTLDELNQIVKTHKELND